MTEKKKDAAVKADADAANNEKPLPAFVKAAPELLPLWDWWVKNGKSTIVTLIVVAVGFFGIIGVRSYLGNRNAKASKGLDALTQEEMTEAVNNFGSTKAGPALKLRLAKNHYDNDRFQDALSVYESVIQDTDKDNPFYDIAVLGRAASLEGLKKYQEAQAAYSEYASDADKSHDGFRLTAQLGAARCKALQQKNAAEAEADLKALKDATSDEDKKKQIDAVLVLLKHYDFSHEDATLSDALTLPDNVASSWLKS